MDHIISQQRLFIHMMHKLSANHGNNHGRICTQVEKFIKTFSDVFVHQRSVCCSCIKYLPYEPVRYCPCSSYICLVCPFVQVSTRNGGILKIRGCLRNGNLRYTPFFSVVFSFCSIYF